VGKSTQVRVSNERLAAKAEQFRFVSRIPMRCECDEPDCQAAVSITLDEYRDARLGGGVLTAPGHLADGVEPWIADGAYWVQRHRRANGDARR
jgi:hypothetical protein